MERGREEAGLGHYRKAHRTDATIERHTAVTSHRPVQIASGTAIVDNDAMDDAMSRWGRIDRSAVSVASSFEEAERLDREYWWRLTPVQRLQALEFSRQVAYGYGNGQPLRRFQRVLEVAELK